MELVSTMDWKRVEMFFFYFVGLAKSFLGEVISVFLGDVI